MMIDHKADQARQDKLEQLYLDDGRDSTDHPLHGTYTGLWEAYVMSLAEETK